MNSKKSLDYSTQGENPTIKYTIRTPEYNTLITNPIAENKTIKTLYFFRDNHIKPIVKDIKPTGNIITLKIINLKKSAPNDNVKLLTVIKYNPVTAFNIDEIKRKIK